LILQNVSENGLLTKQIGKTNIRVIIGVLELL